MHPASHTHTHTYTHTHTNEVHGILHLQQSYTLTHTLAHTPMSGGTWRCFLAASYPHIHTPMSVSCKAPASSDTSRLALCKAVPSPIIEHACGIANKTPHGVALASYMAIYTPPNLWVNHAEVTQDGIRRFASQTWHSICMCKCVWTTH